MNFYELLEIPQNATVEEINKAYKKLARKFHPDANKEVGAAEKFKQIVEANDTLSDPNKRAIYNGKLPKIKAAAARANAAANPTSNTNKSPKPNAPVYNPLVKPFYKFDKRTQRIMEVWPPGFGPKPPGWKETSPVQAPMFDREAAANKIVDMPEPTVDLWGDPILPAEKGFIDSVSYGDDSSWHGGVGAPKIRKGY